MSQILAVTAYSRIVLWVLIIALVCIATLLLYLNRGSDKVGQTMMSALGLAALTVIATIVFGTKAEDRTAEIQAVAVFDSRTKDPAGLQNPRTGRPLYQDTFSSVIVNAIRQGDPALFEGDPLDRGIDVHHEVVLGKILFKFFSMFRWDWDLKGSRWDLPISRSTEWRKAEGAQATDTFVTVEHLRRLLPNAPVLRSDIAVIKDGRVAVPRGTAAPAHRQKHEKSGVSLTTTLALRNPFVRVEIAIESGAGMSGIGPFHALVKDFDPMKTFLFAQQYMVRIHASFNDLLAGNPDMPRYRRWVDNLIEELAGELDWRPLVERLQRLHG